MGSMAIYAMIFNMPLREFPRQWHYVGRATSARQWVLCVPAL